MEIVPVFMLYCQNDSMAKKWKKKTKMKIEIAPPNQIVTPFTRKKCESHFYILYTQHF